MAGKGKAHTPEVPIDGEQPRTGRTLVLCFDGTSNKFCERNTNVVKLYGILKKDKPESQLCYYQSGVGTYFAPGVVSPLFRDAATILDLGFAWYLSEHIMDGYKFLMQNYHKGDDVYIFGFSRGAYTARALAGMLDKVGLLSKDNPEQIPAAYKLFKSSSNEHNEMARRFKKAFCVEVPIQFLGVWDTVASVGAIYHRTLPFIGGNGTISVFRQALALDERRANYRPNLYHRLPDKAPSPQKTSGLRSCVRTLGKWVCALNIFKAHKRNPDTPHQNGDETDWEEVWFVGRHSDVGGGLAKDTDRYALSNIPLRWMIREIKKARCHIDFDEGAALELWNISRETFEEVPRPSKQSGFSGEGANASTSTSARIIQQTSADILAQEDWQETEDAGQEMGGNPFKWVFNCWWIPEVFPTYFEWQNDDNERVGKWGWHFFRGREVPSTPRPKFHESVKKRMDNLNYTPNAQYDPNTVDYVS